MNPNRQHARAFRSSIRPLESAQFASQPRGSALCAKVDLTQKGRHPWLSFRCTKTSTAGSGNQVQPVIRTGGPHFPVIRGSPDQ